MWMKKLSFSVVAVAAVLGTQAHSDDNIIFEQETTTTVSTPLDGGMVVQLDSQVRVIVARRESTHGKVRIGSQVITSNNRDGVVKGMFLDRNRIVVYDSYYGNQDWQPSSIAVTSGCIGPYCVGDTVFKSDNRSGKVVGYFGNGQVVIKDDYYGNQTWNQSNMGLSNGCSGEFCTGDNVIMSNNRAGRVIGFMANGKIMVYDSYYGNQQWSPENLAMTHAVCTNIFVPRVTFCSH